MAQTIGYYVGRQGDLLILAQSRDLFNRTYLNAQAILVSSIEYVHFLLQSSAKG